MKHIIVLRHAKSNWDANYDGDLNRPITETATLRAKATGKFAKSQKIKIDLALVSIALRTQQTFKAFCQGYGPVPHEIKNEIYHGDLKTILNLVQKADDAHQTLMLVGHEPTCSFFTEQLLKTVNQEIMFRTSTIAKVDFEADKWADVNWLMGSLDWIKRVNV